MSIGRCRTLFLSFSVLQVTAKFNLLPLVLFGLMNPGEVEDGERFSNVT